MAPTRYAIRQLVAESGVAARTLRDWTRQGLLPAPIGRGRGAQYDQRHLLRARVVHHLRTKEMSIREIGARIAPLNEEQLAALLPPPPRPLTADGVPVPPAAPNYPFRNWEVLELADGLLLMVDPQRGAGLRRMAADIYRHYALRPDTR